MGGRGKEEGGREKGQGRKERKEGGGKGGGRERKGEGKEGGGGEGLIQIQQGFSLPLAASLAQESSGRRLHSGCHGDWSHTRSLSTEQEVPLSWEGQGRRRKRGGGESMGENMKVSRS